MEADEERRRAAELRVQAREQLRVQLHGNLGLVAMQRADWGGVVRATSDALSHDPSCVKALYRRGVAQFEQLPAAKDSGQVLCHA